MTAFQFHSEPLRREWLDAYGHLNEAYYLVPFSNASWKMQEHFGIGVEYFRASGCALYTLETHLRYLREVRAPADLQVETLVFGADEKRMRFAHLLTVDGELRATAEFMALHYDTRAQRSAPFPPAALEAMQAAVAELPEWAGRRVSFSRD
ncbi:MAG: thioesterase family protein [Gammaproteobacteria bacterium]|nr:thioesterase family protein [Gammaproteobacteria bacterium]